MANETLRTCLGFALRGGLLAAALGLLLAGCSGGGEAPLAVSGKVTFQGTPVEEGTVTFEDSTTGSANEAPIGPGGAYTLQLAAGNYAVTVVPPIVSIDAGPDTPPDEGYKQVANIPQRYWTADTSGLTVTVGDGQTEHNLELVP